MRNRPCDVADDLGLPPGAFVAFGHPERDGETGVKPRLPQSVVLHRERYAPPEPEQSRLMTRRCARSGSIG
jgi:hypothetical protein